MDSPYLKALKYEFFRYSVYFLRKFLLKRSLRRVLEPNGLLITQKPATGTFQLIAEQKVSKVPPY